MGISQLETSNDEHLLIQPAPCYVVGIGASAGGLESLELLFRNLPRNTGMAFVVLQHLSPDFKSMMFELLARDTEIPIHRVDDGMRVEADNIYLLPPRKEMIIAGGALHLTEKDPSKGLALPIDHFFDSLARECGARAVGIVLSGSGSDGSRGVREIARAGGLVISESPESAKFDSMPLSAQASGAVDVVLRPEQIGAALMRHAENPAHGKRDLSLASGNHSGNGSAAGIDAIYELFRNAHDIDFSVYRDTTVLRRINRRLSMTGLVTLDDYVDRLMADPTEVNALYKDLLIGVTQFFRDADAFEYLRETLLPEMLKNREPSNPIRVWTAGCATGEEAYSLAILFHEAIEKTGRAIPLKIFATDVHKASLEFAGRGVYRGEVLQDLTPEQCQRYFIRREDSYQISPEIRKLIVFAPHNVLRDAPFTDLDFVSCRNLLIYFQPAAQSRALSMFHYALKPQGTLFLGGSESPGELSSELEAINESFRLFKKRRQIRLPGELRAPLSRGPTSSLHATMTTGLNAPSLSNGRELSGVYDQLLNRYMPPSLLVDDQRALLDSFNGAEKLLRLRARQPLLDVLDLVDPNISTTLSGAIQRASKDNQEVRFSNVKLRPDAANASEQAFNLTVTPLRNASAHRVHYIISFIPLGQPAAIVEPTAELAPSDLESSREQIRQLEDDLHYSRENLKATIEELETSNEELQATNEELIASNEELQSTNEELHSVNEELYTVNAEHQRKIGELAEVNQDMSHLLENTDVATVFLDRDLRIRRFTQRSLGIFDLLDQDVGRPISSFSAKIPIRGLLDRLQNVLQTGNPYEQETHSSDGTCYLLRAMPYRPANVIEGVVLMLVDVSSMQSLRGQMRWMSAIVESTDDAIIGQDLDGNITSWNAGAERLYGYTAEEAIGCKVTLLIPQEHSDEVAEYLKGIHCGERMCAIDTVRRHKDGRLIPVSLTISPVRDEVDGVIGISKIARDITPRIELEEAMRQQVRQREQFLAMLSHELRNPLGAVLNASRLLRDLRVEECDREAASATIERQVSMMRSLLNDLLDVSRISHGKIEIKREPIDLRSLLDAVRETTQPEIARRQSSLVIECSEEPLPVMGDSVRLVQVQVNLIHNAAKYSPPGSEIRVKLETSGDQLVISVVDQGAGISKDFLPKVFDPFVQADSTLDRRDGGLGVGLTLVKFLVEQHGGRIEAQSDGLNCGSTFRAWLPRHREPQEDFNALETLDQASSANVLVSDQETPLKPKKIVLVEDGDDNRRMLKALLELDGHEVVAATNGEIGMEAIRMHRPDIALIDIGLPGISGYDIARIISQDERCRHTMLVALTGYGQESDVARAIEHGFRIHLGKPVAPESIREILAGS